MTATQNLGFIAGINLDASRFTADQISGAELLVQQFLQEYDPTLNVSKTSTIYETWVRPSAIFYLMNKSQSQALQATQSIKGIQENPDLASDATLDAILSNDGIVRRMGSKAYGRVRVNLSAPSLLSVPSGTTFTTASGLAFQTQDSYVISLTASGVGELPLYTTDDAGSQYYFLLPVVASDSGLAYQLPDMTELTSSAAFAGLVSSFAFGDFQGGLNDESNDSLIARIPEAKSVRNLTSRLAISSAIKENFPSVIDVSVQGMADPAMLRNADNILSFKAGGYVDIYARTSSSILFDTVTLVAEKIDETVPNQPIYSVQLGRGNFPGHYYVRSIVPTGATTLSTYSIVAESRGLDVTPAVDGRLVNHLSIPSQGAYSSFQTNTIHFRVEMSDAEVAAGIPDSLSVSVEVAYLPTIADLQEFVSGTGTDSIVGADYLVRAPIPCIVSLSTITVEAVAGTSAQDIRAAVYEYLNSVPMGQPIRVDVIISTIKQVAGVKYVRLPITVYGEIMTPAGTIMEISSNNLLDVPFFPLQQVVPETVAFFASVSDIPISLIEL